MEGILFAPDVFTARVEMRGNTESERILVIDEDSDACEIMVQALRYLGYPCVCVTSPGDALRLTAERGYIGIFTELVLPGLSGFDIYHAIRRSTPNARTPVIALSGYHEYRHRALAVGFGAFVAKPIEVMKLRPVLEELVPLSP